MFLSVEQATTLENALKSWAEAELAVLYTLDTGKPDLAVRLPHDVPLAWRLFGYELYGRRKTHYLSERSLALHSAQDTIPARLEKCVSELHQTIQGEAFQWQRLRRAAKAAAPERVWRLWSDLKCAFRYGASASRLFEHAVERIDLFLCLSSYKYEHLTQHWPRLPPFVQLPMWANSKERDPLHRKDNAVVIGNSGSIWNNRIDIIHLVDDSGCAKGLTLLVPFSYGTENYYSRAVRHRVAKSPNSFRLLEDFLPRDEYFEIVTRAKAAVFNCHRQMTMGNVFELLRSGAKVYLNTRNVMYQWLTDVGLSVYTVEALGPDLCSSNLELEKEEKEANAFILGQLGLQYSRERFANDLLCFVRRTQRGR